MEYDVQIIWGHESDQRRNELRQVVRRSLLSLQLLPCWRETDIKTRLQKLRRNRNDTLVLINERIVYSVDKNDSLPEQDQVISKIQILKPSKKRYLKGVTSVMTGIFIAIFPKCPVCWATYMSIFGIIGIAKLPYLPWLIYMFLAISMFNIYYSYCNARIHKTYFFLLLQITGYVIVIVNWKFSGNKWGSIIGVACLAAGSFYNTFKNKFQFSKI